MNSLVYLVATGMKNSFKELLRKPGKLVLYLFLVLIIAGALVLTLFAPREEALFLPLFWLKGIYFLFLVMFYGISVQKGLTSGDTIFEMSDVNLLFVSPVNPRATLLYGLIRLAKTSFWAGFFILFQGTTLSNFGIGFSGIWIIFGTFILNMIVLSLLSLVIYSISNGFPRRKMAVRVLAVLVFLPLALYMATELLAGNAPLGLLQSAINSPFFSAIPFVGWTAAGTMGLLAGDLALGLGYLGLLVLAGAAMLIFIMCSRSDYYEDVLVATETAFEKKRATQEGNVQGTALSNAKVKVTKTGIGGSGAPAFFYKHLRETFRENRFGFFALYNVLVFVCVLGVSLFLGDEIDLLLILQVLMWMQIFMIGTGRGLKETYSHYIYLIPEPPFRKIIWSNLELVFKTLLESIFCLGLPGLILKQPPLVILMAICLYTLFSLLLLGINYLFIRFSGANISQGLLITIYILAVIVIMLPGLVPAIMVGAMLGGSWGMFLGMLILTVWELIAAFICFGLSKGVLHNCDMSSAKPGGK